LNVLRVDIYWNILTMQAPMNVKSPNNISKWQMGFNSAFKGLRSKRNACVDNTFARPPVCDLAPTAKQCVGPWRTLCVSCAADREWIWGIWSACGMLVCGYGSWSNSRWVYYCWGSRSIKILLSNHNYSSGQTPSPRAHAQQLRSSLTLTAINLKASHP
jgi:hypothetical protein